MRESFLAKGEAFKTKVGEAEWFEVHRTAHELGIFSNATMLYGHVWIMQTPKLAQVSLNWGVDDLDGTVVRYDITKREGHGTTHQELTVDRLKRLICEAGCTPVERDTLYRPV